MIPVVPEKKLTWRQKNPERYRAYAREYQRRRKEKLTGIPGCPRGPYTLATSQRDAARKAESSGQISPDPSGLNSTASNMPTQSQPLDKDFWEDSIGPEGTARFNNALRVHVKYTPEHDTARRNYAYVTAIDLKTIASKMFGPMYDEDLSAVKRLKETQKYLTSCKRLIEELLRHFGKGEYSSLAHNDDVFNEFLDKYEESDKTGWSIDLAIRIINIVASLKLVED
jgi:hypothetical protein